MDFDDHSYTNVDDHRADSRPRMTPRMLPAETVMPTVSYRAPVGPSATPRTVTPRHGSATPPAAMPTAAYRVPAPAETLDTTARAPRPPTTPPRAPIAPVRHAAPLVEVDPEMSVVEMMPRAPRTPAAPAVIASTTVRGELTVVFGCRGGAGSTTLAVNTAAALARAGRSVCIVDLDLQLGDVCVALDLEPQTSLASVAREAHALDGTSLRRRLAQHSSGVCALAQTGHVDDVDAGLAARLPILLDTLRAHFDHVIVDGVRDFGDIALAALEAATKILVVVTQDVPAVRRAARVLTLLGRLAIEESRCALIINRSARRAAIDDAAIERALGIKIAARIREDAKVAEALDAGALLIDIAPSRSIVDDVARVATLCRGGA